MAGSPLLVATILGSGVLLGFLATMLAQLRLPPTAAPDGTLSRLHTGYLLSLIPLMVIAGWAADRFGTAEMLFAGCLLAALGIAGLGLRPPGGSLSSIALLFGAASSCLTTAAVTLMPLAFWGTREEAAASVNFGFIAVGFGALLMPLVANSLCSRLGVRRTMLILALAALVPACLTIAGMSSWRVPPGPSVSLVHVLADPMLWLGALVAVFYFPLEGSLATWSTAYLVECGYSERQIARWLCGFWTVFLTARLVTGQFLDPRFAAWWVLVLALAAAVTLGNLAGAYGRTSGRGLLLMGAWLGPILPTFLGVLLSAFPNSPASAVGAVYAWGTLSSLFLQPVTVAFAGRHKVAVTIRIPLVLALIMAVPALVLALML